MRSSHPQLHRLRPLGIGLQRRNPFQCRVKVAGLGNNRADLLDKGRAPKWYEFALENGFSEADLLVENQPLAGNVSDVNEIDLGIGDVGSSNDIESANNINHPALDKRTSAVLPELLQEAGQQQLQVCLQEFGFQALTADEFIQAGIEELNQATIRACRAGVAFWAAQEALKTESDESTTSTS